VVPILTLGVWMIARGEPVPEPIDEPAAGGHPRGAGTEHRKRTRTGPVLW